MPVELPVLNLVLTEGKNWEWARTARDERTDRKIALYVRRPPKYSVLSAFSHLSLNSSDRSRVMREQSEIAEGVPENHQRPIHAVGRRVMNHCGTVSRPGQRHSIGFAAWRARDLIADRSPGSAEPPPERRHPGLQSSSPHGAIDCHRRSGDRARKKVGHGHRRVGPQSSTSRCRAGRCRYDMRPCQGVGARMNCRMISR